MEVGQLNNFMLFAESLPIKVCDDKILLYAKVTPKASKSRVGKVFNNSLKIYVTNVAEAGQANKAVIELLSTELQLSKNNISIMHGLTDQNKIICLMGDIDNIIRRLQIIISG